MQQVLCDKYGFDKQARKSRLALMNLSPADSQLAQQLHQRVILPHLNTITEQFYEGLLAQPQTAAFISGPDMLRRLKQTHQNYLKTFGIKYDSAGYFEDRLKAGQSHARIGLPLSLYLSAYRLLVEVMFKLLPDVMGDEQHQWLEFVPLINKLAALDMSLAVEVYHSSTVQKLVTSIDHLKDEKQTLAIQVEQDELTKVGSRFYIFEALQHQLQMPEHHSAPWCIAMADLDHFKIINDQKGHLVGDLVLADVAGRIKGTIRGQDILGRYGGEEFLLILPFTTVSAATRIAERIRKRIAESPIHADGTVVPVTISIGVTRYTPGDSAETLIERADTALYNAKNHGRNRVEQQ